MIYGSFALAYSKGDSELNQGSLSRRVFEAFWRAMQEPAYANWNVTDKLTVDTFEIVEEAIASATKQMEALQRRHPRAQSVHMLSLPRDAFFKQWLQELKAWPSGALLLLATKEAMSIHHASFLPRGVQSFFIHEDLDEDWVRQHLHSMEYDLRR